mgnify:FL=1
MTRGIKAKARGFGPDRETILDLETPGFVVDQRDDQGAAVVRFSDEMDTVESERVWLLSMQPESGRRPGRFRFGRPARDDVTAVFQRYDDADLETVSAEVALAGALRARDPFWIWIAIGAAAVLYFVWLFFTRPGRRASGHAREELRMPTKVTPFSVLALLQQIAHRPELAPAHRVELEADMRRIEARHFGRDHDAALDLERIATDWLRRAG